MDKVRTYFTNIYKALVTTLIGMTVTGRYAFRKPVTEMYPRVKRKVSPRYRGILHNKIEDCTGCLACARACPVDCIHIKTTKRHPDNFGEASDGTKIKLWTTQFDIDMALCMECGLCVPPCPTHCLTMTHEYELAVNDKKGMYLEFATKRDAVQATEDEARLAKEKAEKAAKAEPTKGAAGEAKPAKPGPGVEPKKGAKAKGDDSQGE